MRIGSRKAMRIFCSLWAEFVIEYPEKSSREETGMNYWEKTITLRSGECDMNGKWRPGAMLVELQEAAGEHSTSIGCGRETLVLEGIVWVVVRMEIQMNRYPCFGERVTIRTFHRPTRHRFFPRYFQMWDEKGELLGVGSSLWLLMDLESRQSVSADRLPVPLPDNSDMPEPLPLPGGVKAVAGEEKIIPISAVYTDLDVNGHVNNTRYADWLCNALGVQSMTAHPIRQLLIHFDHEIRPEQQVTLHLRQAGLQYQMTGTHDGQTAFEIGGTLMEQA